MKRLLFYAFLILVVIVCFSKRTNAQTTVTQETEDEIYKVNEVDKTARITLKEPVKFYGECEGSGEVTLKVIFRKTGKVTDVDVSRPSPCKSFDKKAVKAAVKIKFTPAAKNGQAVSQLTYILYSYTNYGQ